jgi:hypothetical protein
VTTTSDLAAILLACEKDGKAAPYLSEDPGDSTDITQSIGVTLPYTSGGGNVFAVSDLHLAAGKGADGRFDGCENFYWDESFRRFLGEAHRTSVERKSHTFILNGDSIDFLRVTYVPGRPKAPKGLQRFLTQVKIRRRKNRKPTPEVKAASLADFEEWRQILLRVGIDMSVEQLNDSVSDKEELYGLKTEDFKSVLRLAIVTAGHREFFEGLADWLEWGNRLIVVKGNHDLEWYWLAVRNYLRLDLAERLGRKHGGGDESTRVALLSTVLPNVLFADHGVLIDGEFFLEHGHPYDPVTRVIGKNTVNDGKELNIPFGSFFNRYVLDFLELDYPNLDKIRPTPNILPVMLRQNAFAGMRLLVAHLVFMFKTVPRGYVNDIFGQHLIWRVAIIVAAILAVPSALIVYQCHARPGMAIGGLEWIAALIVIHVVVQALAQAQLTEPDSLSRFARLRFDENPSYRLITFGHTHNPDQFEMSGRWFYNTGTWIPVIETTATNLREDRMFAFLRLDHDGSRLLPGLMQQWDDDAGRGQSMTLVRRREIT